MIELRWVSNAMGFHVLQYRQQLESPYPYDGGSSHEWTEWKTVPYVKGQNGDG